MFGFYSAPGTAWIPQDVTLIPHQELGWILVENTDWMADQGLGLSVSPQDIANFQPKSEPILGMNPGWL